MLKWVLALSVALGSAAASPAQVIYLPVTYQYGADCAFYYGGDGAVTFARAARDCWMIRWARQTRGVTPSRPLVYSDCMPYNNAALYGFTIDDARNVAYRSVPRFFIKHRLLHDAFVADGAVVVPAAAGRADGAPAVSVRPYVPPKAPGRPLIVIPKRAAPVESGIEIRIVSAAPVRR